jgi:hypothetical protein
VPPIENDFAALIGQPDLDLERSPLPAGPMIDCLDLELRLYGIILEHGLSKRGLLLQERDHRMPQLFRERCGAERGERHQVEAVHDGPTKRRCFGVFIIVVDRVPVARERREGKDVCLADLSGVSRKYLTLPEIFKKELRGLARHSDHRFFQSPALIKCDHA